MNVTHFNFYTASVDKSSLLMMDDDHTQGRNMSGITRIFYLTDTHTQIRYAGWF